MQRKLLVTLVASALELFAAAAGAAQIESCAKPMAIGPLDPTSGFPEYITESGSTLGANLSLQRCLDANLCFFDPIVETDPFSLQIGSGGESFWWGADAVLDDPAGNRVLTYVSAVEAAFLQAGPNGEPINGSQFPFQRLRFVLNAPADGTYTIRHPYGTDEFVVTGATGQRDVFSTVDRGFAPNSTVTGPVGPFLRSVNPPVSANGTFIGDAGPTAVPDLVVGAPCVDAGTARNFVEVTGIGTDGQPIDFGGTTILFTDLFQVQGHVFDGRVQTALLPTRTSFSRPAAGAGQIEAFTESTQTATVTIQDGPTIAPGTGRIATPVALEHGITVENTGIDSAAVNIADASALPAIVQLRASDLATANTDPTVLNLKLVDFVDIAQADYDPASGVLTVVASSADKRANPTLTLRDFGTFAAGDPVKLVTTIAPPAVIHVDSAGGGTSTALVRVIAAVAPAAPTDVALGFATSTTVDLSWTDNASNESGFRIFRVNADSSLTQVATAGVNATSVRITGLSANTTYNFVVEAFNGAGVGDAAPFTVSTLALPSAPATAAFAFDTAIQRRLNVSWAASEGATSYEVSRRVGAGAFTLLSTVAAPATSYADPTGVASTTYTYQVVALRTINGITDRSPVTATGSQTSVAAPTSPLIGTATVSGSNVTVNWTDRSTNEWGFQVYRRLGTGAFGAITAVLPSTTVATTGNAKSYSDTGLAGGTYNYRVDVSNWAATVASAISANATIVSLQAVTNLTADINNRPTLSWVDNSAGESGYRAARSLVTVAANGTVTFGAATNLAQAANSTGFREANALTANRAYRYVVTPLSGTTVGPAATVFTLTNALPTPNAPTYTNNNATGVTVNWTLGGGASTTSVGGYEVQRCEVATATATTCAAGSSFQKVGQAVNTAGSVDGRATLSFRDTTTTAGIRYRYIVRAVSGAGVTTAAGVPLVGTFSAGANVLKN